MTGLFPGCLTAQRSLTGKVTDKGSGEPLPGATIYIPDLKTGASSDSAGRYRIGNLPPSTLLVQFSFIGYKPVTRTVDLRTVREVNVELSESAIEAQEVVVTGNVLSSDNRKSSVSITPISKMQMFAMPSTNLVDAIAAIPGLSEISTGGEIAKPVIRGLSYNHVVTINEGVRQEGNQWGDEHGIEIDQFSADRIEVLKGPASLFYGSDALGGVINILEPVPPPAGTIRGEWVSQFSSNERLYANSLMAEGNRKGVVWRIRGTYKNAASFKTASEYVYNSGFRETNLGALLGLNRRWGYSHLHFSVFNTKIGMVDGARDSLTGQFADYRGDPVSGEQAKSRSIGVPFQDVSHYKVSSVSNFVLHDNQFRVNLGYQQNVRKEFGSSADTVGNSLVLNTLTYDVKYTTLLGKSLELVAGISGMSQFNRNRGTEYLVPDYVLQDLGGFVYVKKSWERFTLNGGMRYDHRSIRGDQLILDSAGNSVLSGDTVFHGFSSGFGTVTGSAGMTFRLSSVFNFKFNIGRGFRAPNIAELSANGVHEGTFRYEIGNPGLNPETSLQLDGEISAETRILTAVFSGFYNIIDDYIYYRNINGEQKESGGKMYPVYRYIQGNSVLKGFEFELDIHPIEAIHFDNNLDYVWAENLSTGDPLPFIPALHMQNELKWTFRTGKGAVVRSPWVRAELETHFAQDRIDSFETTTPGYVLLNAGIGMSLKVQRQLWTIQLTGANLLNTPYTDHLSRLKQVGIQNMGRNITLGLLIPFGIMSRGNE
jgi:iron complex outermembrane recepter protein